MYSPEVKQRAYQLDPEAWQSYSGKPRSIKRRMETRRVAALAQARCEIEPTSESSVRQEEVATEIDEVLSRLKECQNRFQDGSGSSMDLCSAFEDLKKLLLSH